MSVAVGHALLPVHGAGGHEEAVSGAAGDNQQGVWPLPYAGRGVHIHRQEPDDGEDTAPRGGRVDHVCAEADDGSVSDAQGGGRRAQLHGGIRRVCAPDSGRRV